MSFESDIERVAAKLREAYLEHKQTQSKNTYHTLPPHRQVKWRYMATAAIEELSKIRLLEALERAADAKEQRRI